MVSVIDPVFPDDFPELVSVGTNTKLLAHNLGMDGHVGFPTLANAVLAEIPTSGSLTLGGSLSVGGAVTLSSTLGVTGGVTVGGTLTLNSAVYITSLPTSPSGLTAGRLWNNGGVVCVV